ncbi:thioredoxin family protein [Flavobacterium sp.]|jgi:protein disulfide-isomerase|uniref:thioredoxin family protein n=1 Tax=Flavobacterium sp. TaxID=239 RepID=UPI00262BA9AC|nr:thioredoxin family protein [Flavobacterium sp.]
MRKIVITLVLIIGLQSLQAQDGLTWHTDINKAVELSRKEQKPMFLFFTGSDWCGWCIRLQSEVFKKPEFVQWAKEKVILVELDFPRRTAQSDALRQQNMQMQQVFQVRGYPSVYFVKPTSVDGKTNFEQLGQTGYVAGGPEKWLAGANEMIARYIPDPKPKGKKSKK